MKKKLIIVLFLFVLSGWFAFTQENPFIKTGRPVHKESFTPYPVFIQRILSSINTIQQYLNNRMSELSREIINEKDGNTFFILLFFAFAYGIIHALGPGHGKIIMVSYALSNPMKAKQGILLGILIAVIHTLSACILVVVIIFILNVSLLNHTAESKKIIGLVSYGLFMIMGGFLLTFTIRDFVKQKTHPGAETSLEIRKENLLFAALAMGIVPCDGTILILVFSISIGALSLGFLLAIVMSIGMAVTISVIGMAAISSRKGITALAGKKRHPVFNLILKSAGAVVILLFGLLLFLANF